MDIIILWKGLWLERIIVMKVGENNGKND